MSFLVPFDEVNIARIVIKYILNAMQSKCAMSINSYKNPKKALLLLPFYRMETEVQKEICQGHTINKC